MHGRIWLFLKGGGVQLLKLGGGGLPFCDGGDYVTKLADSQRESEKLGGSGGMSPENVWNFDCKWCILNQFRPSTKSLIF